MFQFGHWECDLVMFRKEFGRANVTLLVERFIRFAVILKNPYRQSKTMMERRISRLAALPPQARRSITFDRGTEFTVWRRLKAGIDVDPWEVTLAERHLRKTRSTDSVVICRAVPTPRRSQIEI